MLATPTRECGGCTSKASPQLVAGLLHGLKKARQHPATIVGLGDDASVLQLDADRALITTIDACPPMVDDPEAFGAIAAANAIGDVLAMGGEVLTSLALVSVPRDTEARVIDAMLAGAREVVETSGGALTGGHTVHGAGTLFGLSVTGLVHPDRVWRVQGARPGDRIVLSRPLGVGLALSHAHGVELAELISMLRVPVSAEASALRQQHADVHAVTDVTGYGLLGHLLDFAAPDIMLEIDADAIPFLPIGRSLALAGHRTTAHPTNQDWVESRIHVGSSVDEVMMALLVDPQTTGGLLAAISGDADIPKGFTEIGRVQARTGEDCDVLVSGGRQ